MVEIALKNILILLLLSQSAFGQVVLGNAKLQNAKLGLTVASGGVGSTTFITSLSSVGTADPGFNGKVGFLYIPVANMTITSLGRRVNTGNNHTHVLRLWDAGVGGLDCAIELASVTVDLNGQTVGTDVFGSITPTAILSTHYYVIFSDEVSGGDTYLRDDTVAVTTADATIIQSAYYDGNCHAGTIGGNKIYGSVNFKYTIP